MVNYSTNINKTNNRLLRHRHMKLDIQAMAWNRHTNVAGLYRLMDPNSHVLLDRQRQHFYKQTIKKTCTDSLPLLIYVFLPV